jgi:hypothetical protein
MRHVVDFMRLFNPFFGINYREKRQQISETENAPQFNIRPSAAKWKDSGCPIHTRVIEMVSLSA